MEHGSSDRETEAHITSTISNLSDGINNILPSDAVDAISAFFNGDKLSDVNPNLENYTHEASSVLTSSIDLNDCAKHTLPSEIINIKDERMPEVLDSIKREPLEGIPIKATDELLQQDEVQSDHLVYTTLDNVKSSDGISESSNIQQQFQPIKHEPMFSTPNFNPPLQLRRYPCYPSNYTPVSYPGNSCLPIRTNLNQNYCSNNIQAQHLRWMQGKQQVMVGTPTSHNISTSVIFDVFPENEYASGSASASSSSLHSSSTSDSSPNVQNIVPPNVNSWEIAPPTPIVLGHDGKPMRHYQEGSVQYYETVMNDRESHNMKERERRARVTRICSRMRMVIPGVTETTDKATVFQRGAAYISFLLSKTGRRFDHLFIERMGQNRPMGDTPGVEQNNEI